jgi:hypothetical protein
MLACISRPVLITLTAARHITFPHTMTKPARSIVYSLLLVPALLLTVVVYFPGLGGDYMFDDMTNLLENPRLKLESLDLESIQGAALSSGAGMLRRPVSMLSFALNQYFFGISPYSHKIINLVIHLLTGIGLYLLSRLLVQAYRTYRNPELPDTIATWLPLVATSLWLVHPLNLTSVLYIVQRMTSLASLFMVCGLCLYMVGRLRLLENRRGIPHILAALFLFGGLAIFSKENGVLLPLYMFVLELTLFRFRNRSGQLDPFITAIFTLFLLLPGLAVLYVLATDSAVFLGAYQSREFTLAERLLTEARVLVFYLKMIIMPSITELGLQHDDIPLSQGLFDPPATFHALMILAGLLLGAVSLLRKQPLISLGILWFFSGHMLESTFLPLEIAHEHRNYLASFGILLALTATGTVLPLKKLRPVVLFITPALFLCLFSYTTWLRAEQWSDNVTHAVYEARHHPDSLRSVYGAGRIYAGLALAGHSDSKEKAYTYLEQAARMDNSGIMPHIALIQISYVLDDPIQPYWFDEIYQELEHNPVKLADLNSLYLLIKCPAEKCTIQPERMETLFRLILKNRSVTTNTHTRAAAVTLYGYYLVKQRHDFSKGLELFKQAVILHPREPQYQVNLIELLVEMQQFNEAEQQLASFQAGDTHGGNKKDFRRLQEAIAAGRNKYGTKETY